MSAGAEMLQYQGIAAISKTIFLNCINVPADMISPYLIFPEHSNYCMVGSVGEDFKTEYINQKLFCILSCDD
jgi:hypothetical protein